MTCGTIREEPYADVTLRLLNTKTGEHRGIILKKGGGLLGPFGGDGPDEIWDRLKREVLKADRAYVGFDGARARSCVFSRRASQTPATSGTSVTTSSLRKPNSMRLRRWRQPRRAGASAPQCWPPSSTPTCSRPSRK